MKKKKQKLRITNLRECKLKENPNANSIELMGEGRNFANVVFDTPRGPIYLDVVNLVNGNFRLDVVASVGDDSYMVAYEFKVNKRKMRLIPRK